MIFLLNSLLILNVLYLCFSDPSGAQQSDNQQKYNSNIGHFSSGSCGGGQDEGGDEEEDEGEGEGEGEGE